MSTIMYINSIIIWLQGFIQIFTTGGKIWKTAGNIDSQTIYIHMYISENSWYVIM